ncbi:MAG TPA: TlpA disulfide reductase family protein [Terracidiphilus sp.]|jgi:peroxiredoxin
MITIRRTLLSAAAVLLAAPLLYAQASESVINKQLDKLRSLSPEQRSIATAKLALDIRSLHAGPNKVKLAYNLAGLSTEGDAGHDTLQAVADTLAKALAESPVPAKGGQPPAPYSELAELVRYEHVTATLDDPLFAKATQTLSDEEADIQKADFTLKDLKGKKVTLSELRGKIVLINFWATWCPPCMQEMPDLDRLYNYFQPQGLIILSITDEQPFKVSSYVNASNYHPTVLLDPGGTVHKQFHVEGIPRTFIFNRDGKLIAEAIDRRIMHQWLEMLSKTDLHP